MSAIDPPESFAVDRLGVPEDCRRLAGSLIEARDNAVRAALLKEITVLANQYFEGRTLYHDALEAAFDEVHDKYTQPKEPTSG